MPKKSEHFTTAVLNQKEDFLSGTFNRWMGLFVLDLIIMESKYDARILGAAALYDRHGDYLWKMRK